MGETKICADCKIRKPIEEFYLNKKEHDGHSRICKLDAKLREEKRRRAKGILPKENSRIDIGTKRCQGECGLIKPVSQFTPRKDRNDGYRSECRECTAKKAENRRRSKGVRPYYEVKECSLYLGVHVAERVLAYYFKTVHKMPLCNPGYDFLCGKGFKIDVKASTKHKRNMTALGWQFEIANNEIADYFLCLAFDNREYLNPLHIWLIPGMELRHLRFATISESTLAKWSKYEKPIDLVITCCDALKTET